MNEKGREREEIRKVRGESDGGRRGRGRGKKREKGKRKSVGKKGKEREENKLQFPLVN